MPIDTQLNYLIRQPVHTVGDMRGIVLKAYSRQYKL
ncbi:MAG: hypothetical protein ACJAS9_003980 [Polaribacter sp.]|jgi:hypothetical protein